MIFEKQESVEVEVEMKWILNIFWFCVINQSMKKQIYSVSVLEK